MVMETYYAVRAGTEIETRYVGYAGGYALAPRPGDAHMHRVRPGAHGRGADICRLESRGSYGV